MGIVERFQPRRLVCALLQLVTLVSGCSSWQVQTGPVPDVVAQNHPKKLRVTRVDQSLMVLENPRIRNDTLFGVRAPSSGEDTSSAIGEVALADVTHVAIRRTDGTKTALFVLGCLVVAGGVAGLIVYEEVKNID